MARLSWIDSTPVDSTNLAKLTQDEDLKPQASTYNGSDGRTLTHNYGHLNYMLIINPKADSCYNLGEVWHLKAANTVVVYNSGGFKGAFDYIIIPHA